jgi:hypothetical protein
VRSIDLDRHPRPELVLAEDNGNVKIVLDNMVSQCYTRVQEQYPTLTRRPAHLTPGTMSLDSRKRP